MIEKFNNIEWARQANGSPDLKIISEFFDDYASRSKEFVDGEDVEGFDFIISDFVYEAFPAAKSNSVPCYGVAHFTWDWFFFQDVSTTSIVPIASTDATICTDGRRCFFFRHLHQKRY